MARGGGWHWLPWGPDLCGSHSEHKVLLNECMVVEEPESRKLLPRKAEVLSLVATVLASDSGGRWSWLTGFLSRYLGWGRMGSFIPEGNRGRKKALRTGCGNPP